MAGHTLRFHGRAAALAGMDPEVSAEAAAALDRFEAVHGRAVPASVREWFALAQGADVLRKFGNGDAVYGADRLGREEFYYWPEDNGDWPDDVEEQEERPIDPVGALGLLPFLVENQGVWVMAVRLDGSEDPPVVISFDEVTPSAAWRPCADRFSDLVHARIWDAPVHRNGTQLATPEGTEPSALLDVLRRDFTSGPPTADGLQRYSRDGDRQRVLVEQWRGRWHTTAWAADEASAAALAATLGTDTGAEQ
ncbi:hypothetical protein [Kitasatospora sp. NPDC051914]|uniref:hypothetical protein n=1 Tax=Kitasatospora sp. NPDC051914 TaxID=3154945 RepID=UPI003437BDFD